MTWYTVVDGDTRDCILTTNDLELAQANAHGTRFVQELPDGVQELHCKKYIDGEFVDNIELLTELTSHEVREERDQILIKMVDPIISNSVRFGELSSEKQEEWLNYRRDLLNLPQQEGFPLSVSWPTKPT